MKTTDKPDDTEEEVDETPDVKATEDESSEDAPISEEFQHGIMSMIKGASKHELAFARQCINDCEDEQRKATEKPVSMDDYPS